MSSSKWWNNKASDIKVVYLYSTIRIKYTWFEFSLCSFEWFSGQMVHRFKWNSILQDRKWPKIVVHHRIQDVFFHVHICNHNPLIFLGPNNTINISRIFSLDKFAECIFIHFHFILVSLFHNQIHFIKDPHF